MSLQLRRGIEADRTGYTFVQGEPIYTTDTKELFIGDGFTAGGVAVVKFAADGVSNTLAVRANDSRLSDARTPLAHTHPISDITSFQITSVSDNDVIQYSSSVGKWVNTPQVNLVDGGNF
jgi:hypothetical protein